MRLVLVLMTAICLSASCKTAKTIDSPSNTPNAAASTSNGTIQIDGQDVPLQSTTSQRPDAPAKTDSKSYQNQYKEHAELKN